jgi:YfiH family protein
VSAPRVLTGSAPMFVQAASLGDLPWLRHAFFTREGGVSEGIYRSLNGGVGSRDDAEHVRENRARMAQALGIAVDRLTTPYQIHSPEVVIAEAPWTRENAPRADAVVTATPGLGVGITTADCGPVLFADPQARVVGAAHSGWKGALGGVIESTVAAMEQLGAARSRIRVALGPMIRQPSYEVGADLIERFQQDDTQNARFFVPAARPGHALFDLAGFIAMRLARAGVGAVEDLGLCTYAEPDRFFSYRRATHRGEPDYGRHVNAIAISR